MKKNISRYLNKHEIDFKNIVSAQLISDHLNNDDSIERESHQTTSFECKSTVI